MSVPIGLSFGDVVESIKILRRVVHAIKDQRHASEGYQRICRQVELDILVLQQLQSIKLDDRFVPYTQGIHALSKEIECEALNLVRVDAPWKSRVESILVGIKDSQRRDQERLMATFATTDQARCSTLGLIRTGIAQVHECQQQTLAKIEKDAGDRKFRDQELIAELIPRVVLAVSQRRETAFIKGNDGIEARISSAGTPISNDSKLALLRTLAQELVFAQESQASQSAEIDLAILGLIMTLLAGLVRRLMYRLALLAPMISLSATPANFLPDDMRLIDPLGRVHRLPMQYFQSWEQLAIFLETQFRGLPGDLKVRNREFKILDIANPSLTIGPFQWKRLAKPRGRFLMSMAFPNVVLNDIRCIKCKSRLRRFGVVGYICPHQPCGAFFHVLSSSPESVRASTQIENEQEWIKALRRSYRTPQRSDCLLLLAARGSIIALARSCQKYFHQTRFLIYHQGNTTSDILTPHGPLPPPSSGRNEAVESRETVGPRNRQIPEEIKDREVQSFCNISVQNPTPLYDAATKNDLNLARDILRAGHDINESTGQFGVAINAALIFNHSDMLELLLENGATLLPTVHPRLSPLCVAAHYAQPSLAIKVFSSAALCASQDPGQYQRSLDAALCASIRRRDGILTEAILGFGANPIKVQDDGQSALELSLYSTSTDGTRDVLAAVMMFGLLARNFLSITELSNILMAVGYPTNTEISSRGTRRDQIIMCQRRVARRISATTQYFMHLPYFESRETVYVFDVETFLHEYESFYTIGFQHRILRKSS
ncbi:hypothetical protein PG985_008295 [Apiospora marii]|uniref:uncharacterized protein n=1 Tax=Apiospora marii TaxID=335849 RepID=UPI00312FC3D2